MDQTNESRRAVFRAAIATGCVLCVPAAFAADAPAKKVAQTAVQYQQQPKGEQKCALCMHFIAESSTCKLVEGKINPNGWCTLWAKKA